MLLTILKHNAYLFLASALTYGCTGSVTNTEVVSPDSQKIKVTGRVKREKDMTTIYWPGTSVRVKFSGTALKAYMKDERGENYFNIIIDDDSLRYIRLDTLRRSYVLADGLAPGDHTVELIKRTEWDKGKTWFYGLEVSGSLQELPEKNTRVIEFFGNSITAGYAIEDYSGNDSPDSIYTNNYYTYAAITARHFNADYHCTVKSGIGIMVSWFDLTMPEMYDRLDPSDSLSKWDFTRVVPNVVVINLFQNDSWLVNMPEHPSFRRRFGRHPPQPQQIVEAYSHFVSQIRNVYPDAWIICALGSMDATREGSPWPDYVRQAVDGLEDKKILIHFFGYTAKDGHPRKEDNKMMASSLINFIEKNVRW